jgi:response regulator RpfG family c-di-GMP phosphodiesterase
MLNPESREPVIEQRKIYRDDSQIKILFVDDSRSIRLYYQRLLERNNYLVVAASSVEDAYRIAVEEKIDIAIVDYFMP